MPVFTRSSSPTAAELAQLFPGESEMARRMRALDWSATDLGNPKYWPESLRTATSICLTSRFPIVLWWGPSLTLLYNDAYIALLGPTKHPQWLGRSGRDCWHEIWGTVGPMLDEVMRSGKATWSEELLLIMNRHLPREEAYFTFSYSPILVDHAARVGGIFCAVTETTEYVLGRRRLGTLRELGRRTAQVEGIEAACRQARDVLADNRHDVPFAALYVIDKTADEARLQFTTPVGAALPEEVRLDADAPDTVFPIASAWRARRVAEVALSARVAGADGAPWPEPPTTALVVPIVPPGIDALGAVLVVGVSPRRVLDATYRDFFQSIATQIGAAIADAYAYETERTRAEMLSQLDRAKTAFFSNVSHEFRTPLTLMLGPLEEALRSPATPAAQRESLQVAHRNSLRLLRLVNTLLDFSRIEAGRVEARYEPVDVARFTSDVAGVFRSTIERAGLRLRVDCAEPAAPVHVDRDMWEKIVLNLLSNAFKYTLRGGITVTLADHGAYVDLAVADTGVGIPPDELRHVFERFHRVRGTDGRTHEGTGIGLALVHELVKLHGGEVRVESEVGVGSTFTVRIPTGTAHLPTDRLGAKRTRATTALGAAPFVEEAMRWLPAADAARPGADVATVGAHVLVADDNADMRAYLTRLLAPHWSVEAVADGEQALAAARRRPPDLILSDVMMPRLDGLGLVRALRADPTLAATPIILVSARAGEASQVAGIESGADDYLTKPFAARELVARVNANLALARARREALQQQHALADELRAQGVRLQAILDTAPLAVWIARDPECRVIEGNRFANALFGVEGGNVSASAPPEERAVAFRHSLAGVEVPASELPMQRAAATGAPVFGYECDLEFAEGRRVKLFMNAVPLLDDQGKVVGCVAAGLDITDRHREETLVQRQREALELAIAGAPIAEVLATVVDAAERYANEGARAAFLVADAPGMPHRLVAGSLPQEYVHAVALLCTRGREAAVEPTIVVDVTGDRRWQPRHAGRAAHGIRACWAFPVVSARGVVLGTLVVHHPRPRDAAPRATASLRLLAQTTAVLLERDRALAERDRAAAEVRDRAAQIETLLNEAPLGVYLVDADLRIRSMNPVARPVFGPIDDLVGRDFGEVMHTLWSVEYADEVVRIFRRTLETGEPYYAAERVETRRDRGVPEVYEWQVNRIPLPDGRFGVVCYFRDVSAAVEARERIVASEERARLAQADAEQANRAKDDFLATVSHELRSPLQGILGWLSLLKHGRLDADQTAHAIAAVERSVRLQAQLVHDIMDISRIVAGRLELERAPLDIAVLVHTTVDEFMPAALAKRVVLTADGVHCGLLMGDRERMHQVLSNLLANALKFTPSGGTITVGCARAGDEAIVTVTDNGEGIAAEFLPRLFDRFTQAETSTTRRHGGLGLGLAIVRHLVELHGGQVAAASSGKGHGASFTVRLPLLVAEPAAATPRASAPARTIPRLDGVEVLLVEDDRAVLDAMAFALEATGAHVRAVDSARAAWDALQTSAPDVLVSDIAMPDEDGYSLLRRIRTSRTVRSVPAIALTGFARPEDKGRVLAAGFSAHVAKPVDPEHFVRVLVDVLREHRALH